jgi:hypothetical protein
MVGIEKRIKKLERQSGGTEGITIIFLTMYSGTGDSDNCKRCRIYAQTLEQPRTVYVIPNELCKGCTTLPNDSRSNEH